MISRKRFLIFLIIPLFLISFSKYCYSRDRANIRVCVASGKDRVLLRIKGPYKIESINSELTLDKGRALKSEYIAPTNSGLKLGDREFKIYGIRIIPKKDAAIFIDKNRFRGIVHIIRTEQLKLLVVNHLDIEKYLYGVLYHEVPCHWPMEALKAQAIAARTFALYRIENMRDRDYDVTSDIYSQVYGGILSERRRTKKAVNLTRGKVLTYNGNIIPAYYHAMCGGHTESAKDIFGIDLPSLGGKACRYCKGAPHMYWKRKLSYRQVQGYLDKYGINVKGLKHIETGKRNKSGRIESIKVKDSKGAKEIKGYKFRLALGPNAIKSTNFTAKITPKGVIFRGKGWGHGVGMCQWGVFGMAKRRFNHREILEFYYPLANIEKYDEVIGF
ncbi:MAG: SpoIID/LytB domain-containing protein [Candidatus Omnitrophota bacterium]|nr:MAG: SpoIID/LytB domain-containing protein [Candidatus Omnitrophota bacterium]